MDKFVGHKIVAIRNATIEEQKQLGWIKTSIVIVLDNGIKLTPSQDEEGNGPGTIFVDNNNLFGGILYPRENTI